MSTWPGAAPVPVRREEAEARVPSGKRVQLLRPSPSRAVISPLPEGSGRARTGAETSALTGLWLSCLRYGFAGSDTQRVHARDGRAGDMRELLATEGMLVLPGGYGDAQG